MSDVSRMADPSQMVPQLPANSAVIIRDPDPQKAQDHAVRIRPLCRKYGVLVLLACPEPPSRLVCDGVHIPERALSNWRRIDLQRLGPALVTTSAHSQRAIQRAARFGADGVLVSPVFPTNSHPGASILGYMRFTGMAKQADLAVIALGGIQTSNIRRILLSDAHGIAGISLFSE